MATITRHWFNGKTNWVDLPSDSSESDVMAAIRAKDPKYDPGNQLPFVASAGDPNRSIDEVQASDGYGAESRRKANEISLRKAPFSVNSGIIKFPLLPPLPGSTNPVDALYGTPGYTEALRNRPKWVEPTSYGDPTTVVAPATVPQLPQVEAKASTQYASAQGPSMPPVSYTDPTASDREKARALATKYQLPQLYDTERQVEQAYDQRARPDIKPNYDFQNLDEMAQYFQSHPQVTAQPGFNIRDYTVNPAGLPQAASRQQAQQVEPDLEAIWNQQQADKQNLGSQFYPTINTVGGSRQFPQNDIRRDIGAGVVRPTTSEQMWGSPQVSPQITPIQSDDNALLHYALYGSMRSPTPSIGETGLYKMPGTNPEIINPGYRPPVDPSQLRVEGRMPAVRVTPRVPFDPNVTVGIPDQPLSFRRPITTADIDYLLNPPKTFPNDVERLLAGFRQTTSPPVPFDPNVTVRIPELGDVYVPKPYTPPPVHPTATPSVGAVEIPRGYTMPSSAPIQSAIPGTPIQLSEYTMPSSSPVNPTPSMPTYRPSMALTGAKLGATVGATFLADLAARYAAEEMARNAGLSQTGQQISGNLGSWGVQTGAGVVPAVMNAGRPLVGALGRAVPVLAGASAGYDAYRTGRAYNEMTSAQDAEAEAYQKQYFMDAVTRNMRSGMNYNDAINKAYAENPTRGNVYQWTPNALVPVSQ